MWASAEMVMRNTKCHICSHDHLHTKSGEENAVNHFLHVDFLHDSICMRVGLTSKARDMVLSVAVLSH